MNTNERQSALFMGCRNSNLSAVETPQAVPKKPCQMRNILNLISFNHCSQVIHTADACWSINPSPDSTLASRPACSSGRTQDAAPGRSRTRAGLGSIIVGTPTCRLSYKNKTAKRPAKPRNMLGTVRPTAAPFGLDPPSVVPLGVFPAVLAFVRLPLQT